MGIFRRKVPSHLIPVHPANAVKKDWVIVLEAGTIVGPSPERLRVARCTQERKIVKKYNILLRAEHFLLVEGYDPRIHTLYFCPQLYRYDPDKKLVPLQGEEIGRVIAQALEGALQKDDHGMGHRKKCRISQSSALQCKRNLILSLLNFLSGHDESALLTRLGLPTGSSTVGCCETLIPTD
jgi:hypothetical protein